MMATTMEQRAKFRELRTSGVSREEAQTQAYGNIAPIYTPTAPVAPVADVNSDANRLARLQASGGSPTAIANLQRTVAPPAPVTPAPMVQAPVDPTTGLSKPLEPATPAPVDPVAPVAPLAQNAPTTPAPVKPVKTEAPIDYTQAKGRETEIQANLDAFQAKGMTPDEIMRASDYQNASPEKRALIDPYLKQQIPTASAMYSAIANKLDVPDEQKTSLSFKIAQNRYTKASSYATMTPSQLSSEMTSSRFIQGSQAYEDVKAMNPKLVQDTENLRIVNGSKQNIFSYTNNPDGSSVKVNHLSNTFKEEYMDNFGDILKQMYQVQTPEQIRAMIYTPDVKSAQDKAFEIEGKLDAIDALIEGSDKAVEASLAGSGASGQRIQLEKQSQREKLDTERKSIEKDYTRYANKANNLITQNTAVYTTQQQQKQQQNAAMLPFITDKYKTQQEAIAKEKALNDPATQIEQTMQEFAKMGIVAQGNTASKIAEFKASGKTLPEYISGLRAQFMSKPEYQKMLSLKQGELSDVQKLSAQQNFDIQKIKLQEGYKDKNIQRVGGTTDNPIFGYMDGGKVVTINGSVSSANAPTATSAKYLDIANGTDVGVQCGQFARQLCGLDATPGGNSLSARVKAFNQKTPVAGGMVLFSGSGYDKTYGHISSIESVNTDGTLNIVESNLKGDNKVTRRTIQANDKAISGFYNNTPLAKSAGAQASGAPEDDLTKILKGSKLGEGAKTSISKIQGVIEAINTFAKDNQEGDIEGVSPLPSWDMWSSKESISNRGYLDTINLVVQQWASGASLTESQIKQVNKLVPGEYDTDKTVKAKMNNLRNFMNDQVKATLNISGIDYNPVKKDLWANPTINQPAQPLGNTTTGGGQLSQQAQSIEQKWLSRNK